MGQIDERGRGCQPQLALPEGQLVHHDRGGPMRGRRQIAAALAMYLGVKREDLVKPVKKDEEQQLVP